MNLIRDRWIPVVRQSGHLDEIAPVEISATENPPIDFAAPRPDFQGALAQFLIGLLQTTFAPDDSHDWRDRWFSPPDLGELEQAFHPVVSAFDFSSGTPSFMQDHAELEGDPHPIFGLLIDAPGGKTLRDNIDFFVKRGAVERLCPACAAMALFTLQINAPSGGAGHRTGLRGGGPLTTLVLPDETAGASTLWHRLWLNVLSREWCLRYSSKYASDTKVELVFPWLAPTRTSEKTTGVGTHPQHGSFLQMYWAMPRRIRLDLDQTVTGDCDLCGKTSSGCLTGYRSKNYGVNYEGPWQHPLTPYRFDLKQAKPPLPLHGQRGGISYRYWLGIAFGDQKQGLTPADVVSHYLTELSEELEVGDDVRIWGFGYDMDNMKARCWYEATMPLYHVSGDRAQPLRDAVSDLIAFGREAAFHTRQAVKQAWFHRPAEVRAQMPYLDAEFWEVTERDFFDRVTELAHSGREEHDVRDTYRRWQQQVRAAALDLFDRRTASGPVEDLDMRRLVEARRILRIRLDRGKAAKALLSGARAAV